MFVCTSYFIHNYITTFCSLCLVNDDNDIMLVFVYVFVAFVIVHMDNTFTNAVSTSGKSTISKITNLFLVVFAIISIKSAITFGLIVFTINTSLIFGVLLLHMLLQLCLLSVVCSNNDNIRGLHCFVLLLLMTLDIFS